MTARAMRPPAVTRPGAWLEDLADPAGVLAAQHNSDVIGGKVTEQVGNLRMCERDKLTTAEGTSTEHRLTSVAQKLIKSCH